MLLPSHLRRWPRAASFSSAVACKRTESTLSADLHVETEFFEYEPCPAQEASKPKAAPQTIIKAPLLRRDEPKVRSCTC